MYIEPPAVLSLKWHFHDSEAAERDIRHTLDEFEVLADIGAPTSQVVVHPHRDHQEVLICVHIYPRDGVEIRIAEYYVALCSPQPGIGIPLSQNLSRAAYCATYCNILCKKAIPERRPRSTVRESIMTDRFFIRHCVYMGKESTTYRCHDTACNLLTLTGRPC